MWIDGSRVFAQQRYVGRRHRGTSRSTMNGTEARLNIWVEQGPDSTVQIVQPDAAGCAEEDGCQSNRPECRPPLVLNVYSRHRCSGGGSIVRPQGMDRQIRPSLRG